MATIKIDRLIADRRIVVYSPYNATFVSRARKLAGKWNNAGWVFPEEVEEQVRELLRDVYGQDDKPLDPMELLRLRVKYRNEMDTGGRMEVNIAGRQIARIFGRDSGARLGEDVIIIKGGFTSGGSRNNPSMSVRDDTEFDLLRVPVLMAAKMVEKYPEHCRIVAPDGSELRGSGLEDDQNTNVVNLRGNQE